MISEAVQQAGGPLNFTTDANGRIDFQQYLKVFTVVQQMIISYVKEFQAQDKFKRRELLKAKKENEYQILCQ